MKAVKRFIIGVFMFGLLVINFNYNVFNPNNEAFYGFQSNSDALVLDTVLAKKNNIDNGGFGCGFLMDSAGYVIGEPAELRSNIDELYKTNEKYDNGYARNGNSFVVDANPYSLSVFIKDYWVRFKNGEEFQIDSVEKDSENLLHVYLKGDVCLSQKKNGSLYETEVFTPEKQECPKGEMLVYKSQYGLHGKVYRKVSNTERWEVSNELAHIICVCCLAAVIMVICHQLRKKYDFLMSIVFYIVFLLSPWVVNFARSVYWLEFLWFIPLLIGLIFVNYGNIKSVRFACYIMSFIVILIKALCGYEYISTIMIGLVTFPIVEMVVLMSQSKDRSLQMFKRIVLLSVMAICGFLLAFILHANIRGDGNVWNGVVSIFKEDILRSTVYGWNESYGEAYEESMNAPTIKVLLSYFLRNEEIVSGINGKWFLVFIIVPVIIFFIDFCKNKLEKKDLYLYVITFISACSWFVLAKSHSAMHGFLNYVLWYFGFIQICFYIIIKQFIYVIINLKK